MTKNKLLNIAILACKGLRILWIFIFTISTLFFIHFQINKDFYKDMEIKFNEPSGFNISSSETLFTQNSEGDKKSSSIQQITTASLYINYIKFTAVLLFYFLSLKEFQKVIESVKHLKTFQLNNVNSFRRIGKYAFIIFILSSFTFITYQHTATSGFQISFTPLILMLLAFILAEIFKEGNMLRKENDLTI
ncbi:DUF2975 domain-containing protein [Cellulophaga sp. F20128]|uniref:DUF2975 domain-containing protein n=1 Tax=Cellulophaga sp. F20128 TaxID=2926413 RepID=UPI001FF3A68B|nr:DUF2975 domain-containing protein [Cellulophaga sp. F20128]MCK0157393.1 DUF2975 domain-containing protein [Cellulophaga sp. F20128]